MRILLVIDSLGAGGAERQMTALAVGLARKSHSVILYHYYAAFDHFRKALTEEGIAIVDGSKSCRYSIRPTFDLVRLKKSLDVDVVISYLGTPNIYNVFSRLVQPTIPIVVSERSGFIPGRLTLRNRITYMLYTFADSITVNSYHQYDKIVEHFPWLQSKVHVVYNGVDLSRFAPSMNQVEQGSESVRLLAIGSLYEKKNAKRLIKALAECVEQGIDVHVSWLGRISEEGEIDGEFADCCNLLKKHSLESRWMWLGERQDVVRWIRNTDALIHPSLFEGLPNAICESLACGKVVLAGNICDHARLLGDGSRGWLFDPTSTTSISNAIAAFSQESTDRIRIMEDASRNFACAHLGQEVFLDRYEEILTTLTD